LPLWDGTQDGLQYILDLLAQSVIDTGGRQVKERFGLVNVGAGADVTVTHGLGTTPLNIQATWNFWPPAGGPGAPPLVGNQGATTFSINNPTAVGSDAFWRVIG
jgi:hypothetical protein